MATQPTPAPACPVLNCPWQESEDDKLEGHLYDAHSARALAATLTTMLSAFETQAAIANGLLNEPATPAHYCPACRTTTPAPHATAEALVQASVDHQAECTGQAAGQPNCPCAPDCSDCDDIGCEQCGDCACTGDGCRSTFHNRNNEECR